MDCIVEESRLVDASVDDSVIVEPVVEGLEEELELVEGSEGDELELVDGLGLVDDSVADCVVLGCVVVGPVDEPELVDGSVDDCVLLPVEEIEVELAVEEPVYSPVVVLVVDGPLLVADPLVECPLVERPLVEDPVDDAVVVLDAVVVGGKKSGSVSVFGSAVDEDVVAFADSVPVVLLPAPSILVVVQVVVDPASCPPPVPPPSDPVPVVVAPLPAKPRGVVEKVGVVEKLGVGVGTSGAGVGTSGAGDVKFELKSAAPG